MQDVADIETLAGEAVSWFETATRADSGETFDRLKDGRPEWLHDLVYAAHDGLLPDDWRYSCIRSAVSYLADGGDPDDAHDFADSEVDIYNGSRFAWLASSLSRQGYVDDAVEEFGWPEDGGVAQAIGMGQYMEAQEVFASVVDSLRERAEEVEDEN